MIYYFTAYLFQLSAGWRHWRPKFIKLKYGLEEKLKQMRNLAFPQKKNLFLIKYMLHTEHLIAFLEPLLLK